MRLAFVLALLAALPARADDVDALRAENARLRERVEQLERENAALRGVVRARPAPVPGRVVERETAGGATVWATEPGRLDVTRGSRATHSIWLERTPGTPDATLWIRAEFSGGIHRAAKQLTLTLDGTEHVLPVSDYDATRISGRLGRGPQRRDHELLRIAVPAPVLTALGGATTATGQLGRTTFTVPPAVLAGLRALARKDVARASAGRPASTAP
jgi:hypothetical protein